MFATIYQYENFDVSSDFLSSLSDNSLQVIVWGICAGILLGTLFSIFYKTYTASFFRQLISREAFDESRACTIGELDVRGKWFIKSALRTSDKPLRRYVLCSNTEELPKEKAGGFKRFWYTKLLGTEIPHKLPMDKAKFYMPEEKRVTAELRFTGVRHPVQSFLLAAVILTALGFFLVYAIPELLQMLDNFLTQVKPVDNSIL